MYHFQYVSKNEIASLNLPKYTPEQYQMVGQEINIVYFNNFPGNYY